MTHVDLLVVNAGELLTMVGPDGETMGARRGEALGHLWTVKDGAVAIDQSKVVATGSTRDIRSGFTARRVIDARGGMVMPGFVDGHTHLAWAGSRAWELEWKVQGKTYPQITAAGGGIPYTVKETRNRPVADLVDLAEARMRRALATGTTTIEAKSGYGLDERSEIAQLRAIGIAAEKVWQRVYRTYLGAHEKPPEHRDDPRPYLEEIRTSTLRKVRDDRLAFFCDAFVEKGVFMPNEVEPLLKEAKRQGLALRLHVDEFHDVGGARFAVELGARSADHLLQVSEDGIDALASSDTVATLLPLVPFAVRDPRYAPARQMVEAGCIVGLASDFNPNVPCLDMQTVVHHAVYGMGLTPKEALVAATVNAGYSLDPRAGLGVLAPGHPADLIVTTARDHLEFVYDFGKNHVRDVVVAGQVVPQ